MTCLDHNTLVLPVFGIRIFLDGRWCFGFGLERAWYTPLGVFEQQSSTLFSVDLKNVDRVADVGTDEEPRDAHRLGSNL